MSVIMEARQAGNGLHQTSFILYIAIDDLIPSRGKSIPGLDEFTAALDHRGIPAVWLTSRTRLQMDEPRRKLAHTHPFIAEDGCGVFLPEDYFHLRPQSSTSKPRGLATVRLGRFTCLPIAEQQPAASEALEALAAETGVSVVPLESLSPRELAQNTDLPPRDAEWARQRDFDELFFFAGASERDIEEFQVAARTKNIQLRRRGVLWSLAIGASTRRCVGELSKLYDRALRSHARTIGVATEGQEGTLFAASDRAILLTDKSDNAQHADETASPTSSAEPAPKQGRVIELPLRSEDTWEQVLAHLAPQR
jgi:predicted mannosyl-3-phosphoglycerate phosphatase (HAD superfamily)